MTGEEAIRLYPVWIRRREALEKQMRKGLSESEFIETLNFFHPQGEKVQTGRISDKTGNSAISYKEIFKKRNDEFYKAIADEYFQLSNKLRFLETAFESLSGDLPELMKDLVIKGLCLDDLEAKYNMSRSMLYKHRKKALKSLTEIYKNW